MGRTEQVLELAREAGFDDAAAARLGRPRDGDRFEAWLAAGRHAGMGWLERDRARILDPGAEAGAAGLLSLAFAHRRGPVELRGGGRVARYAAGRDYHNALGKLLGKLARALARAGLGRLHRKAVDAAPLLERSHAAEAGLGFPSKSANLLRPDFGPWFFLGELVLDVELEPAPPTPPAGSCGTCTACIDACPTGAILAPGTVDAGRCISYQTIENPGPVPRELRASLGGWVFGCDVCSEVCPWGEPGEEGERRLGTHPIVAESSLADLLRLPEDERAVRLNGSPLQRPQRTGLARNAALALGHHASDEGRDALLASLATDPSPVVREAAGWSLGRAHGADAGVRSALEAAAARARGTAEGEDLARSLDEAGARRES